ncbi:hypothetical protein K7711_44100 [Nocardia sp. CA2R105]|uniref:hypothetical protein n=1 Tax=Nocardia coffeae TaxID=2873381 RepID=UPI001CA7AEAD|nr:hypothetical protein [Nocardia coffeae]MBY8863516.1 hypothetical protein [Nocardia coffeae]
MKHAAALLELLTEKFGPLEPSIEQRVQAADIEQLRLWSRRVLRAATLEQTLT